MGCGTGVKNNTDGKPGPTGPQKAGCANLVDGKCVPLKTEGLGSDWHPDPDGDGVPSKTDKCPYIYDPKQRDRDSDGTGDYCDDDFVSRPKRGEVVDLRAEHVTPLSLIHI